MTSKPASASTMAALPDGHVPGADLVFDGQIEGDTIAGKLTGSGQVGDEALDISVTLAAQQGQSVALGACRTHRFGGTGRRPGD